MVNTGMIFFQTSRVHILRFVAREAWNRKPLGW